MKEIYELCEKLKENFKINCIDGRTAIKISILLDEINEQNLRKEIAEDIYNELGKNIYMDIWIYSFLIEIYPNVDWVIEFLDMLHHETKLDWRNKVFLYYQISCMCFRHGELSTDETVVSQWKYIERIYSEVKAEIGCELHRIPKEERNEKMAVVLAESFISTTNGPTKTTLDRCFVLKKVAGMDVLLINTAELNTSIGELTYFIPYVGIYNPQWTNCDKQVWNNVEIPFFQCDKNMPDIEVMKLLLQTINNLKPSIVVSVASKGIFTGLVNELVPVINISTTQSGLQTTLAEYQTVEKHIKGKCSDILRKMNKPSEHLIAGRFTFSFKEQQHKYSRSELGIKEDEFVLVIVGARLEIEFTWEFMEMLESIADEKTKILAVGTWDSYADRVKKYTNLKERMVSLGHCEDVLAILDNCDLYINPIRRGGGTSAVEAMYKGKPVVTVDFGDVAGIVGEDFVCNDYEEMKDIIKKYKTDKDYYESQSQKAKELARECMDSENEFMRILSEYKKLMQ